MVTIKRILEATEILNCKVFLGNAETGGYSECKLLEKNTGTLLGNSAYIGYAGVFNEMCFFPDNALFLLISDCSVKIPDGFGKSSVIVIFPASTDFFRFSNIVEGIFFKDLNYNLTSNELLKYILYGQNLYELADKVALIIKNPVLIMDLSNKLIAHSRNVEFDDVHWKEHIEMGCFSFEYSSAVRRFYAATTVPVDSTPYKQKNDISPNRRIISRLYANGIQLGFFVALEANKYFDEIDMDLYRLISDSISNILKTSKTMYLDKGYPNQEAIFIDLLNGHFTSKTSYQRTINKTGVNDGNMFQLLHIDISGYTIRDTSSNFLLRSLENMLGKLWSFFYDENIVAIIDLKNDDSGIKPQDKLEAFFLKYKLSGGLSSVFTGFYDIRQYYNQALRAQEIGKFLSLPGIVYEYEDCKFFDMLSVIQKYEDKEGKNVRSFCNSKIFKIIEFDKMHSTEYLKTLWAYLNCGKNVVKTARKLHIHKNTATYRIQRITQFFSIDLEDDSALFKIYYSYLMLPYISEENK